MGVAIYHRIAIDGPTLSTSPHRVVGIALMGHPLDKIAADGIINCHVIATAIGAEMVLHRGLGMSHRQVVEELVATVLRCPEHHVKIHHIVHDGIVRPVARFHLSWPTQDGSHNWIEECGERISRSQDDILVILRMIHLISLAVRAEHQKADVVIITWAIGNVSKTVRIAFGCRSNGIIAKELIVHPENARPKAVTPLLSRSLTAVPSFLLIPLEDIARLYRVVERAILLFQFFQSSAHLLMAVLQLLIHIKPLLCIELALCHHAVR